FFAGPAAVIWGYQNLLKLVGKSPDDAFPEGTWQFYVEYALRDDTARHVTETHGFDTVLQQHAIRLSEADRLAAWLMAAVYAIHQYPALLENEWRERVYTFTLRELTVDTSYADRYKKLYRKWEAVRPYGRGTDVRPGEDYPLYRRRKFDHFIDQAMHDLPSELRRAWLDRVRAAETGMLPAYQRQMSILTYLDPGTYGETRVAFNLDQAQVGIIYRGHYYLVPICAAGSTTPIDYAAARSASAALLIEPATTGGVSLSSIAGVKRRAQGALRGKLNTALLKEIDRLRHTPMVLNFDRRSPKTALIDIRQGERGIGDHALTVFDTGATFVFDQSHIFFDGSWGAALAEILTNEALSWAVYFNSLPLPKVARDRRPAALSLSLTKADGEAIAQAPQVMPEVCVENRSVDLKAIAALRQLFRRRSELLEVTVNDLLVLYRAIHAATYQPDQGLVTDLKSLLREPKAKAAIQAAVEALAADRQTNPAILIPVDASQRHPHERVYPMTFEAPLRDLDLLQLHARAIHALEEIRQAEGDHRAELFTEFDQVQRMYLATLAGYGEFMSRAKAIALTGESASVGTIKLLAHMPQALQRLLDRVPGRIDVLNDLIKGREVFSNVGAVARSSTLTRFATAKDDNDKKMLAWGVLTDAQGVMHVTLRDFRPHVGQLIAVGLADTARRLAQDYVDAYARGLNRYIRGLQHITLASHSD
ncbi:MAG TPA: hypothetical protein VLG46_08050, partial [Anaerolineae bacterium]|nr:hypothetical protein [Anaerolineae bacterium]